MTTSKSPRSGRGRIQSRLGGGATVSTPVFAKEIHARAVTGLSRTQRVFHGGLRGICTLLKDLSELRQVLQQRTVPHYTTPQKGKKQSGAYFDVHGARVSHRRAGEEGEAQKQPHRFLKSTRCTVRLPSSALSSSSVNSRKTRRPLSGKRGENDVVAFAVFVRPGGADAQRASGSLS